MTAQDLTIKISISSRFENIDLVDLVMESTLGHLGFDDEEIERMGLAIREAVSNGVRHGNQLDPDKFVELNFDLKQDEMILRITDEGEGFDLSAVPDPLAPENLFNPSGRGILLMRSFMDEVSFESASQGGTVVMMRKRLPPRPEDAAQQEEGA